MSLVGQSASISAVAIKLRGSGDATAVWDFLEKEGKGRVSMALKTNIWASYADRHVYNGEWSLMTMHFKGADMRDLIIRACESLGLEWELVTVEFITRPYEPVAWEHVFGTPVEAA